MSEVIYREKAIANIEAAYCCGCENYNGVRCRACQIMDAIDGELDEEHDDYIIPKGWWEYRHFNQDEVYNNRVDYPVVGWMPLPPNVLPEFKADAVNLLETGA